MTKKNICFYGASVIKQQMGIVDMFKNANNINFNIFSKHYTGTTIENAGVCYINEVLKQNPDYCFLDWFSSGFPICRDDKGLLEKCMDAMFFRLLKNKCIPIVILIYRIDGEVDEEISEKRILLYEFIKNYCKKYNIHCIDLYTHPDVLSMHAANKLLADNVHTLPMGAKKYAEIIEDYFYSYILDTEDNYILPPENEFCHIKNIQLNSNCLKSIEINGNGKLVGIGHVNGPHSGIIYINIDESEELKLNTWDKYCYVQRNATNTVQKNFINKIEMKISQEEFCRKTVSHQRGLWKERLFKKVEWALYKKMLRIRDIFYTGQIDSIFIDDNLKFTHNTQNET
jgi:hypothetical protein